MKKGTRLVVGKRYRLFTDHGVIVRRLVHIGRSHLTLAEATTHSWVDVKTVRWKGGHLKDIEGPLHTRPMEEFSKIPKKTIMHVEEVKK